MKNLVHYKWFGHKQGCVCSGSVRESCSEEELKTNSCVTLNASTPTILTKWKGFYICGSIIKNKNYFELAKSENRNCFPKHKYCGELDSLGNLLCVPEGEQCPVNKMAIRKQTDENNFNIETSNSSYSGRILNRLLVTEGVPCAVPSERVYSASDNTLISSTKFSDIIIPQSYDMNPKDLNDYALRYCKTPLVDEQGNKKVNSLSSLYELDEHTLTDFYRYNKLDLYKVTQTSQVKLFGGLYRGWKKECETSAFSSFFKLNDQKEEIRTVYTYIERSSTTLVVVSLVMLFCIVGAFTVKHQGLLKESHVIAFILFHVPVVIGSIIVIVFSGEIGGEIKNSKHSHAFFELIQSKTCSDKQTNSELLSVAKDFFDLNDKYFNLRIFSILIILLMVIVYILPLKSKYEKAKKKNYLDYYNKLA
eukprot:CAMPEP_0170521080 /NCGR_PEP_ID=MMETSP0209-20121228/6389_1 /TAXON_ID=665100 ORGANISM="Litonotus pictus, Strain P1" /NCGR_SAMPLE_ID=MMETSP0209 /ASSEMBLY_ACC=CAM_ASM_000301 /LENGTH=419 /DNA_ID=CAMNT_0010807725 /DNA_START=193 /DNA_END=1452 /DNA_ORIENTATION=+